MQKLHITSINSHIRVPIIYWCNSKESYHKFPKKPQLIPQQCEHESSTDMIRLFTDDQLQKGILSIFISQISRFQYWHLEMLINDIEDLAINQEFDVHSHEYHSCDLQNSIKATKNEINLS